MTRLQHIIPSAIIAAVGAWVTWISFTQTPAEAFLFPRLISVVFLALALWTLGKAVLGLSRTGTGLSMTAFVNLCPGLVVMAIYVFWAAKGLGFYTATTLAVFALLSIYDPAPAHRLGTWVKRAIVTAIYMAVMYGLFAIVLKVYTPREIFF